jgi:hypothetical protein
VSDGGGSESGGRTMYVGVLFNYLSLYTEAKVIGYFLLLVCCLIALVYFGKSFWEGVDVVGETHMHRTVSQLSCISSLHSLIHSINYL